MDDGSGEIGSFEYEAATIEAWQAERRWHVRSDGRECEARLLDEAVDSLLGSSTRPGESASRLRLVVEILAWSRLQN